MCVASPAHVRPTTEAVSTHSTPKAAHLQTELLLSLRCADLLRFGGGSLSRRTRRLRRLLCCTSIGQLPVAGRSKRFRHRAYC
jgi:hypothetical protein